MTSFTEHLQEALGASYQLDRELTGGGMSRVFVAIDRSLGRKVVVKVLPPELAAGVNRERFRREIQVAAQLQHPHIVQLFSAGEHGDLLWYTMPYIEGESLRAALEQKKTFSVREVMRIMHDIVDALSFAHAAGVIHRDIKPANILTQRGHALVTDFGVAKAISASLPITTATAAGIAIGTPAYMAPEQLAGDANADHRMDIYAAGLLIYELLTGESPFAGPSPRETMAAQLTRDPKPLHEVSASIPRSLSLLVMRCLAKDPAKRPETADDVLRELDSMTMPMGITPQEGGIRRPVRRPRRTMVLAGGAAAIVIAAFAVWATQKKQFDPPAPAPVVATNLDTTIAAASAKAAAAAATALAKTISRPAISRADSIAIAEAVRKREAAQRTRDSIAAAKKAEQVERRRLDSIIAANSGGRPATATAVRRVIVTEPRESRSWPQASLLGRAVVDSLKRMLRVRPRQYTVIDQDAVRAVLARSRMVDTLSRSLNAELIVSVQLTALPGDSALLLLNMYDMGADRRFQQRTAAGRPVPRSQVLADLDALLLQTLANLEEMSRGARKAAP